MSSKDTNPKDMVGSSKLPIHLWPETATALGSIALLNGALKYGRANWRVAGVRASIYYDAFRRHTAAWFEGEETDPDDGVDHLGAALACLAILVDARAAGKLNDDRQVAGGYREYIDKLSLEVPRLKELHKDKTPYKHYIKGDEALPAKQGAIPAIDEAVPAGLPEWYTHKGIVAPKELSPDDLVGVRLRDGTEMSARRACTWIWSTITDYPRSEITAWKYA